MLFKEVYVVVILAEKKIQYKTFIFYPYESYTNSILFAKFKKKLSDSFQGSSENTGTLAILSFHNFQIVPILTHVQNLRNQMVSFSPNDVIFVMNKWDSLCMETELKKKEYTENTKESLQTVWRDVDDDCILQLSVISMFI